MLNTAEFRKLNCTLIVLFPGLLLIAQSHSEKDISMIKQARAENNAAIAKHDTAGIARHLLSNFVQVRGNSGQTIGKDLVLQSWQELFNATPEISYIRTPSEIIISTNDTLAWETGSWKAIKSYSKGGKYTAQWKRSEGIWKIRAELFVSLY